jgi:PPOX class probable F420-dependent enzyme
MTTLTPLQARARFAAARVARLATIDRGDVATQAGSRRPHLVPIVFAVELAAGTSVERDTIYSAVDAKPKRTTALRRLANVVADPAVSVLVDHYDDADWDALWWARADGTGLVLAPDDPRAGRAVALLSAKYPQHANQPPAGPVLAIEVQRWSGWAAAGGESRLNLC